MVSFIEIHDRVIGDGNPCFIIAEAGVNHNGDIALAKKLINVAVDAGADAVKFQTFKADQLVSPDTPKAAYQKGTTSGAESQFEMLRRLELSLEAHRELKNYCFESGVLYMSTPFDETSADFLAELGLEVYKTSSGDITNLPLLTHIACKAKPMIISTGMATLEEVDKAVRTVRDSGNQKLVLLHCVSNYPTHPVDVNLRAMHTLAREFDVPVGFSDHTTGIDIAIAAVALGARVLEKHFTLDRNLPGPDHQASVEPDELTAMVASIRRVEAALGDGIKQPVASELLIADVGRRSLHWNEMLSPGTIIVRDHLIALRPGTGISPARIMDFIGCRLCRSVQPGEMVFEDDVEK
ncbi:MAG: N-acetylneuraminate synthase [Anaerolineae bacterium]|nr:N-acetylneuraminate synthase [Anaerolineae bacterium]